jgi:hypothetical protein
VSVPARTEEQRAAALQAALTARTERARLRLELKDRRLSGVDVIEGAAGNPLWAALKVTWLLGCLPGIGEVRAERLLASAGIAPSRRIQGLGLRQRAALIELLTSEGR